jgi:hypothetical protein
LKGLKYLPGKVKQILAQEEESNLVASQGMSLAGQKHTWTNRAEEVMDYLEQLTGSTLETDLEQQAIDNQNEEVFYQKVFLKNSTMIKQLSKVIRNLRKQDYLHGMRGMASFLLQFNEMIPVYLQWQSVLEGMGIEFSQDTMLQLLQNILEAQKKNDYIMLADLLELQLVPFLTSIQEGYAASGFVVGENRDRYRIEPTSSGAFTLAVQGESDICYLHTNGNPYEEGRILAESWFDGQHYQYVVYGLGLGYHIQALLEIDETIQVTVLEPDANILSLAEQYGVAGIWKENSRVTVLVDEDFQKLTEIAQSMGTESQFVIHYPSLQVLQNVVFRQQLENYFIEYSSAQTQINRLVGNFIKNSSLFQKEVTLLKEAFEKQTVYIIAAGPSLDRNMLELKKVKDKGIILATGTVLKKLLKAGITPDYVMITDSGASTYKQIEGLEDTGVPLLYLSTVYYKIPAEYPVTGYVICQKGFDKSEAYAKEKGYPVYESGGSVTTTALEVSIRLGAKRIVLVGADMAYTGNRAHASDTVHAREVSDDRKCMVTDIHGNQIPSAPNLNLYREWIEQRIAREKDSGIEFIDATEGGAKIAGTKILSLRDVLG